MKPGTFMPYMGNVLPFVTWKVSSREYMNIRIGLTQEFFW